MSADFESRLMLRSDTDLRYNGIKMPDFDLTLAPLHNKYSAVPRVYKIDWPWLSDVSFV